MLEVGGLGNDSSGGAAGRRLGEARPTVERLALALVLGIALGGCSVTFGDGGEPTSSSPEERRRERSRLYMEAQHRMELQRQFDRPGPTPDR
jgi:hypothetical protein